MIIEINRTAKSVALMLLVGCISCASPKSIYSNSMSTDSQVSLYQKLGERPAIDLIINNLVNIIGQDDVVFAHFAQSNVSHFKKNLAIYLCHLADGPCQYKGDTMQDIHRGMFIDSNQFNHFVELFISAMDASGISYPVQNQLLARLAPLRESIIKM